jgi:hypothetical protein
MTDLEKLAKRMENVNAILDETLAILGVRYCPYASAICNVPIELCEYSGCLAILNEKKDTHADND